MKLGKFMTDHRVVSRLYLLKKGWVSKIGSTQIGTCKKISKLQNKESVCSKQLKIEKKKKERKKEKREIKPTYPFANKSLFLQNFRPLSIAVSQAMVMQTC